MNLTQEERDRLAEVYEAAADYLEEHGWTQRGMGQDGGPRCLMGSIFSSISIPDLDSPQLKSTMSLYKLSAKVISRALELDFEYPSVVGNWNDDPCRSKDEVINLLHALANKLR